MLMALAKRLKTEFGTKEQKLPAGWDKVPDNFII
jgi:hypothetical protein